MATRLTGLEQANKRLNEMMGQIAGEMTEKLATEVVLAIGGHAASYTPIATSALINSQYHYVRKDTNGWKAGVGYGVAPPGGEYNERRGGEHDPQKAKGYAQYVHDAPGTLMGTNTPRHPKRLGTVWGPNGEPRFLEKGVDIMMQQDLAAIIQRSYKI